jgi:hypothetical protein
MMDKQCEWRCPICKERCGGIEEHEGEHQCPTHYQREVNKKLKGEEDG